MSTFDNLYRKGPGYSQMFLSGMTGLFGACGVVRYFLGDSASVFFAIATVSLIALVISLVEDFFDIDRRVDCQLEYEMLKVKNKTLRRRVAAFDEVVVAEVPSDPAASKYRDDVLARMALLLARNDTGQDGNE